MTQFRKMTVGARMAELFKAEKVSVMFGPGDVSHVDVQKHAEREGLKIVGPRHEAAGGFMADAYARMTGRVQVVTGAMGPGVANMLPAAVCAQSEHIPVVFLGAQRQGVIDSAERRSRFLHASFLEPFGKFCKYSAAIRHPGQTDDVVRQAFRAAASGTPGPVYVECAWDMQNLEWEFPPPIAPAHYRVLRQQAADADIDRAVEMLMRARLPIIVAGMGIHLTRTHRLLEELTRVLRCPVLTTYGGLGALPDSDPQWFPYLVQPGHTIVGESDAVLGLGTSAPESMNYGRQRHWQHGDSHRKWILVERDAAAVGVNRPIDLALIGDLDSVLRQLIAALKARGHFKADPRLSEWRRAYSEYRRTLEQDTPWTSPIHTARLMLEARKAIPDDAVICHDGGYTLLFQLATFERRSHDFIWASKFAHLGTGLPYALGAQIAAGRDRPVALITGDGAFGFHISELETAVRHKLPVVCIVNYDRLWGAEALAHMQHIGHLVEIEHSPSRLDRIAEAFGGHGEFVENAGEIAPAIHRAFESGKPSVVQVVTDPIVNGLSLPPNHLEFMSWLVGDTP
ncbi:MAG: thiamine pyrophosphate-binding protein, partial [Proteobacteria bacterium]|nr:thiamine pyrophosphate-binding protein [Pseudomonadota bacterium]